MCTVTIIRPARDPSDVREGRGRVLARIACSRDESPLRAKAAPPSIRQFDDCTVVFPIDDASGGTWVAANDAGLAFLLLNWNDGRRTLPRAARSRGEIIPRLLDCVTLAEARHRIAELDAAAIAPCRVVMTDGRRACSARIAARTHASPIRRLHRPAFWTSSGLGDAVVRAPRAALFRSLCIGREVPPAQQDLFHRHRWPERPDLSVCMKRPGAETVSYTTIELRTDGVEMRYFDLLSDRIATPVVRTLPLRRRVKR